jgi:Methyltransferase domain
VSSDTPPTGIPTLLERQQLNIQDPSAHTFWHWVRFDVVAEVARARHAAQVLDIGAGSGMLGDWMATHVPTVRYRFEELSPVLDAALTTRFGPEARHDPAKEIGPDTVVTMLDVVEHIEDDLGALGHLATRMDAGSTLVLTVPALQWAFSSWDVELGHHRRYSRRQIRSLLERAGFEVHSTAYLFPEMLVMLPVRKLRPGRRSDVDFPRLSDRMNRLGYAVSHLTARWRRLWPAGTSVVAIASRPAARP